MKFFYKWLRIDHITSLHDNSGDNANMFPTRIEMSNGKYYFVTDTPSANLYALEEILSENATEISATRDLLNAELTELRRRTQSLTQQIEHLTRERDEIREAIWNSGDAGKILVHLGPVLRKERAYLKADELNAIYSILTGKDET